MLLLIGAGLMIRSLVRITQAEPGFDVRGISAFRLSLPQPSYSPDDRVRLAGQLLERLAAAPDVEEVSVMVGPPLSTVAMFGGFTRMDRPAPEPGEVPIANYRAPGVGALEMLGIPLLSGRTFQESDRHDARPVVLINQRAAERYFAGQDPVGRRIFVQVSTGYQEEAARTIVGVVGDIRGTRRTQESEPEMYVPYAQAGAGFPHVLMHGRDPTAMLKAARRALHSVDPELPLIQPGTLDTLVDQQLEQPRFYVFLLGLFSFFAVVLAAVGIYGVVAYAVSQRTREIGVRVALGARVPQVVRLVLWQGLRPALWGVAIGIMAQLWGGSLLRGILYQVAPQDPGTLIAVPVLLLWIVVLACAIPAARASRISPATALRSCG